MLRHPKTANELRQLAVAAEFNYKVRAKRVNLVHSYEDIFRGDFCGKYEGRKKGSCWKSRKVRKQWARHKR